MSLILLVDWDNLDGAYAQRGLLWVAERALVAAINAGASPPSNAQLRLYGGWFDENRLSRRAQDLSAQAQRDFPRAIGLAPGDPPILTKVELAYSLAATPSHILFKTYRLRSDAPSNLAFRTWPPTHCGNATGCALTPTASFLQTGQCPRNGCSVRLLGALSRPEQKLVDTMLVADMIHYAMQSPQPEIVVVTSDDDVIPGICAAVHVGARVIQLHTRPDRKTDPRYIRPLGTKFLQSSL